VDLIVHDVPRGSVTVAKPFTISFVLTVTVSVPPQQQQVLYLAIQHVYHPQAPAVAPSIIPAPTETLSPRLTSSGLSTPAPTNLRNNFNFGLAHQKLLIASPRLSCTDEVVDGADVVSLPLPFSEAVGEMKFDPSTEVAFVGPSAIILDPITFCESAKRNPPAGKPEGVVNTQASREFELSYLPLRTGFLTVGGLRVLLLENRTVSSLDSERGADIQKHGEALTLKEWDVIGEVWVHS
jgi:hypothetical protein